jgi:putative peptide zinc metalloprotease protein
MIMAAAPANSAAAPLPPLREEIAIFPGPTALDGSPTWTLHDPALNRFYRLGWSEFEIISRWDAGSIAALTERLDAETTLRIEPEDIEDLARFLMAYDLLRVTGPQATASLVKKADARRTHWATWLLHNYLFMRIPLVRPDRFLTATYPYVRWIYSRPFALTVIAIGIAGFYLVARQWDSFVHTFVDLFSITGAVSFGITLACLKTVHELGHAYTAKRFGCRVPNMGVALLVMVPVLYTDVNEGWKLTSRHKRLAIGIAGVTAELCCAAVAICAWGFLPDGPARSVAFLVATTTWVTTVLLNLSPFMRYDGYYVLSDWLETPNLHARSFALARWWLRETLFGFGDPAPEEFPPGRQRLLIAFALLTWFYRFTVFMGIALIVYHFTFKVIGVAMMIAEVGFFLVRPIVAEGLVWFRRRGELRWGPRTLWTSGIVLALAALLFVPWRSGIEAPALLKSRQHVDVFVPEFGARVVSVAVRDGDAVGKNAKLIHLVSPDLDYKLRQARSEIEITQWQMNARGIDPTLLARSQVAVREYEAAVAEYKSLIDQNRLLDVTAPTAGRVVDLADDLKPDEWLPPKTRLLSIVDPSKTIVEAYINEADLQRIAPGDTAAFHADGDDRVSTALRVAEIARSSTRSFREPYMASPHGGPIAARAGKNNEFIPDRTIYRVTLLPAQSELLPDKIIRGTVTMRGTSLSLAASIWRTVLGIVVREAGP